MMQRIVVLGVALSLFGWGLLLPRSAWAVPAFARTYNKTCTTCHSAWPMLNAAGRQFKENGYQFKRGEPEKMQTINGLDIPVTFPWAMVAKFRPYDEKEGGDSKLRALHEVELFIAGNAWDSGSFFAEFELEDEENFEFELAHAVGGFHPYQFGNLLLGKSHVFHCDPYNTLANGRKLTRSSRQALVQGQSTGVAIGNEVQNVQFCGREPFLNKVFYAATYSADVDDNEGEGPKDWSGRLVFDVLPLDALPDVDLSVGGFLMGGEQRTGFARDLDFIRSGFDLQLEYGGLNLLTAYNFLKDDVEDRMLDSSIVSTEHNNAYYVEGSYVFGRDMLEDVGIPIFTAIVPTVRVDVFTENDKKDDFTDLTVNLSFYPWDNVRFYAEYAKRLTAPGDPDPLVETEPWRWTVQAEIAF